MCVTFMSPVGHVQGINLRWSLLHGGGRHKDRLPLQLCCKFLKQLKPTKKEKKVLLILTKNIAYIHIESTLWNPFQCFESFIVATSSLIFIPLCQCFVAHYWHQLTTNCSWQKCESRNPVSVWLSLCWCVIQTICQHCSAAPRSVKSPTEYLVFPAKPIIVNYKACNFWRMFRFVLGCCSFTEHWWD